MASIPLSVLLSDPNEPLRQAQGLQGLQAQKQQMGLQSLLAPGQLQAQQQESQLRDQAITQGQQSIAARQALNQAYAGAVTKDANGLPTFDREKITSALAQSNQGAEIPEVMKGLQAMDQQAATIQELKDKHTTTATDYLGAAAKTVKDSNYDPSVVGLVLQHASQAGFAQEAQQVQQAIQQNPQSIKPIFDHLFDQSTKQQELGAQKETADARMAAAENNPVALAGRVAQGDKAAIATTAQLNKEAGEKATAEETAKAPFEAKKAQYIQNQENYRAVLARQATQSNQRQNQGIQSLQKQSDTYSQFLSTANSLKQSLAAAKDGNEMAAAVAPLQGTLFVTTAEGVKRINNTELQGVEGAGSLIQKINGALGKQEGKGPLSDTLKDDMAKLVDLYAKSKYQVYKNQVGYTQKLHGLDPASTPILNEDGTIASGGSSTQTPSANPTAIPPAVTKALSSVGPGIHKLSDGSSWMKDGSGNITKQ